jgi:hypothetical protein
MNLYSQNMLIFLKNWIKKILSIILWCLVKHYLLLWTGKIIVTKIYISTFLFIYLLIYSLSLHHSLTHLLHGAQPS